MTQTQTPASDKLDKGVFLVAGVVVLGAIMSILDITVVSVAIPTFQQEFDATPAQVAWTMTGYTLALASVIPLTGWAADRFGTKRLYMLALLLFTLGSVACSMAWEIRGSVAASLSKTDASPGSDTAKDAADARSMRANATYRRAGST